MEGVIMLRFASVVFLVLFSSLSLDIRAQTATPISASPAAGTGEFTGKVDIGGRSLYLTCSGSGGPTVVLDAGLGADSTVWHDVIPLVARDTRVCAYDRAGEGQSSPPPAGDPRALADAVADLEALLRVSGLPGPYVLVGHSVGGMVVRLFAASHPDEVAGLVLVEATTENWLDAFAAQDPSRHGLLTGDNPEHLDLVAGEAELRAAPLPPVVPAIVVHRDFALDDSSDPTNAVWQADQQALATALNASVVVAAKTDHEVPSEAPEVVARAIVDVAAAVRDPASWHIGTPVTTPAAIQPDAPRFRIRVMIGNSLTM
jgi:pimeloyl-ACP methyl ester carboxylesterase